ncbi:MAG: SMP-30/gluconolactonase/LRE family protein [Actinobacteria bacterium]|nr:MAG: SMP-30/gluconolactonase/LRE family protein [Actinomycetota bacterium]
MSDVDLVADVGDRLGEGPAWDPVAGVLWWVDIKGCRLHRLQPASDAVDTWELEETPGAVAPRAGGGLVMAVRSGLALFDPGTSHLQVVAAPEPERPGNRFNDGGCDPQGRFWAGSMDDAEKERTGALYRFDGDGTWERILDGLGIPNTIAWSPDGATFYFAETFDRVIHAYDFDPAAGTVDNRRLFAAIEPPGSPTARRSTPRGSCGTPSGTAAVSSATTRMDRRSEWCRCR